VIDGENRRVERTPVSAIAVKRTWSDELDLLQWRFGIYGIRGSGWAIYCGSPACTGLLEGACPPEEAAQ